LTVLAKYYRYEVTWFSYAEEMIVWDTIRLALRNAAATVAYQREGAVCVVKVMLSLLASVQLPVSCTCRT
jgi:hypothetical protein